MMFLWLIRSCDALIMRNISTKPERYNVEMYATEGEYHNLMTPQIIFIWNI